MAAKHPPRKKSGAEPRRAAKPPVPGWIWLLTGCALGAFIMFLMHLSDLPAKTPQANKAPVAEKATELAKTKDANSEKSSTEKSSTEKSSTEKASDETSAKTDTTEVVSQKPRYDFYRLLKENQAASPRSETTKTSSPNGTRPAELPDGNYILQVASYKTAEDAEALRAKLLLLSLEARSENVTLRNGEVWHRVLIGPLKNHAELTRVRTVLADNKYEALVLKSTKDPAAP